MKVLLTTHVFLPDYASGTEILTLNIAKELQRLGHEVEICTGYLPHAGLPSPDASQGFDYYEHAGIPVNRFFHHVAPLGGQHSMVEAEYNNRVFAVWFRDYLVRFRPDVVHFFHLWLLSASAIDVCHDLGIPMVMTPTDFWLICPNNQLRLPDNGLCTGPDRNSINCIKHAVSSQSVFVGKLFSRLPDKLVVVMIWLLECEPFSRSHLSHKVRALQQRANFLRKRMNRLDRIIAPTRLMERMLVDNGLQPEKVVVSRFGISSLAQAPTRIPNTSDKLRVGFIGGLSEHKGAHLLIAAICTLPDTVPIELNIYGRITDHPEYFKRLQRLAAGDPRIHFCGTFPNAIIDKVFAELDVLAVPSIWYENTPLVIYSAQAAGCPVIASNLGGMAEIVEHEQNGLLFTAGDVNELAAAIKRLTLDRRLLHRLAANARRPKQAAEYAEELQDIYMKLLNESRSRR